MKILNLALGMRFSSATASKGGKAAHESGRRFSRVTDRVCMVCKVVFCCVSLLLTVQKENCQLLHSIIMCCTTKGMKM